MIQLPPDNQSLPPEILRKISPFLPKPSSLEILKDTKFRIYRVKSFSDSKWHPVLRRLVAESRKSFTKLYGYKPPAPDNYDNKSAVYLIKVTYQDQEEWFSMRFVPVAGYPFSNDDFKFYVLKDETGQKRPILNVLQEIYKQDAATIATMSLICAIRPYSLKKSSPEINWARNRYTAEAFALVNKQFLKDIKKDNLPIAVLTAQIHPNLADTLLNLPFVPAYQRLGVKKESIFVDRSGYAAKYVYRHPGYFLNLYDLSFALKSLIDQGKIKAQTVNKYLPEGMGIDDLTKNPRIPYFKNLGKLLSIRAKIKNSELSGNELRGILDEKVRDGQILRIMDLNIWQQAILKMIRFAKK